MHRRRESADQGPSCGWCSSATVPSGSGPRVAELDRAPGGEDADVPVPATGREGSGAPWGEFPFPGFAHYWGRSRKGKWIVKRKPASDRLTRGLQAVSTWCKRHRHGPLRAQQSPLRRKLLGHYSYYGSPVMHARWAAITDWCNASSAPKPSPTAPLSAHPHRSRRSLSAFPLARQIQHDPRPQDQRLSCLGPSHPALQFLPLSLRRIGNLSRMTNSPIVVLSRGTPTIGPLASTGQ